MNPQTKKLLKAGFLVAIVPAAVALAFPPGSGNPVCYVETWYGITQQEEGNCTTYANCPSTVLCGIGSVNTTFSPITNGPYPCDDFTGGTKVGGTCTGGTQVIPSTVTVIINQQTCSGDC